MSSLYEWAPEDAEHAERLKEQCKDLILDYTFGYPLGRRLTIAAVVFGTGFVELTLALVRHAKRVPTVEDIVEAVQCAPWSAMAAVALTGKPRREDILLAQDRGTS